MSLATGTRLGPYEIQSALGGGMGEVYQARDTRLDRTVAIKVLPVHLAADPQFRDRFDREARTISQLDHPHICALHDVGEAPHPDTSIATTEPLRFLVMQYLEGETLADDGGLIEGRASGPVDEASAGQDDDRGTQLRERRLEEGRRDQRGAQEDRRDTP